MEDGDAGGQKGVCGHGGAILAGRALQSLAAMAEEVTQNVQVPA